MAMQTPDGASDNDPGALGAWLRLALTAELSGAVCRRLLSRFGLPGNVMQAPQAALREFLPARLAGRLGQPPDAMLQARIEAALAWAAQPGNAILTLADGTYPQALLSIADPPLLLYASGRAELLQAGSVAVVGSRNGSRQGLEHASRFSAELSRAGITIVSGLALGIDAAAHVGALSGRGSTVAVIGTGIDLDYPAGNRMLARRIASEGCLISEYALGSPALAHHFPRRNRIISGLAQAVLVVEAAAQSGSLITARLAAEQGRDVFALPGSIHSPLAKGCHQLIREGAKLVETTRDIIDELPSHMRTTMAMATAADICPPGNDSGVAAGGPHAICPDVDPDAELVMQAIGHDPVHGDTLAARCNMSPARLAGLLLVLELEGRLEVLPGAHYRALQ